MCNSDLTDSLREMVGKLLSHTNELRLKFSDVHEEFREGNLDSATLSELNQVVHKIETDAADFEKLAEGV